MGPDHSQIEIYEESKHGIMFNAQAALLDLSKSPKELTTHEGAYFFVGRLTRLQIKERESVLRREHHWARRGESNITMSGQNHNSQFGRCL